MEILHLCMAVKRGIVISKHGDSCMETCRSYNKRNIEHEDRQSSIPLKARAGVMERVFFC